MYHMLDFNNGQPIILEQSGYKLIKYTITAGRIYNRGIICSDINKDFMIWNTRPIYISYESVDGSNVICHITQESIREVFITKRRTTFTDYNNVLYIFYLEPIDDTYKLYAITSDNFTEKTLICEDLDLSENLHVAKYNEFIILFLSEKQLFLSPDLKVVTAIPMSSPQNTNSTSLQNEVDRLKSELQQLEEHHANFLKEYDELYAYTGELQKKLREMKLNSTEW